jgi:hypothetical protein
MPATQRDRRGTDMSKTIYFRQCRLVKKIERGTQHQTTWIPEPFACVGKILKLKDANGQWEDGWQVEQASQTRLAEDMLFDSHQGIRSHRKATGDSLPKEKSP